MKAEASKQSNSRRLNILSNTFHPVYVVWELTLACDHACTHCGSRAAQPRPNELNTSEALELADELIAMNVAEVTLIGGEAYLHEGFYEICHRLVSGGVRVGMTTGAWGLTHENLAKMSTAGIRKISVSIDGLEHTHDRMRSKKGSFQQCIKALQLIQDVGIIPLSNTNVNRHNLDDLEALYLTLQRAGVKQWQIQLTAPLGRAADRVNMLLQPYDLLDLLPRIARLKQRGLTEGLTILPGNNLGYFGPEENLLRAQQKEQPDHWGGCQAGRFIMGIESDGAIKGCPSLQTSHYVGARWREHGGKGSIHWAWNHSTELSMNHNRSRNDLWGYCATCPLADTCLGGCTFTAHSFFNRPGNNPYCHFRALQHAKRGLKERLVPAKEALGMPFDNGTFDIIVEPFEKKEPTRPADLVQITRRPQLSPSEMIQVLEKSPS